jgi:DNA-binding LacI/PurR family transcriptional regulator
MQIVTIKDVAKAAGVSIATVSRVINNNSLVTESKRQRVMQVMRELEYVPAGRNSKNSAGAQIIIVVSSIFPMLEEVYTGIISAVKELDVHYEVIISYTQHGYQDALNLIKILPPEMIRGLIFFNSLCRDKTLWEEFQKYPLVQIGEYFVSEPLYAVTTDDTGAMADITRLLISKGRRRFVLVSNEFSAEQIKFQLCIHRETGFRMALKEAGIPFDDSMLLYVDYTIEGGIDAARRIAAMKPLPDAVVCVSDSMAVGCIMELRELGISIPGDMAVTGFDDIELAEFCHPSLTTIRQSCEEMGIEAVRILDALCSGRLNLGRTTFIPQLIIERESS